MVRDRQDDFSVFVGIETSRGSGGAGDGTFSLDHGVEPAFDPVIQSTMSAPYRPPI